MDHSLEFSTITFLEVLLCVFGAIISEAPFQTIVKKKKALDFVVLSLTHTVQEVTKTPLRPLNLMQIHCQFFRFVVFNCVNVLSVITISRLVVVVNPPTFAASSSD